MSHIPQSCVHTSPSCGHRTHSQPWEGFLLIQLEQHPTSIITEINKHKVWLAGSTKIKGADTTEYNNQSVYKGQTKKQAQLQYNIYTK